MGVRKSAATLSAAELDDLRGAFAAAYQVGDDRGYAFHAGVHGLPLPFYCEHGTPLFLPWHRAYLYFFELALNDVLRRGSDYQTASVSWYANQGDKPLASPRGQLYDHIALSVRDLDAWVAKLRGEGVRFLEEPYPLGDTRAVMIEGPSREALELVEIA